MKPWPDVSNALSRHPRRRRPLWSRFLRWLRRGDPPFNDPGFVGFVSRGGSCRPTGLIRLFRNHKGVVLIEAPISANLYRRLRR